MKLYPRFGSRIALVLLLLLSGFATALLTPMQIMAAPPLPSGFYGTVTNNGEPIAAGTIVSAWINGIRYAQSATFLFNNDAVYVLDIPGDDPETPNVVEGGQSGDMIVFRVGEKSVVQTGVWQSGANVPLDLQVLQVGPTITLTGPTSAQMGTSTTLVITGQNTHFLAGTTTVDLGAGITIDSVQVGSTTALTVSVTVAVNALPGLRTVTVTTGSEVVTQSDAFTVLSPAIPVTISSSITGTAGAQVTVPILVGAKIDGRDVISFQFTLTYDPAVLHYVGIAKEDTLSAAWTAEGNGTVPGTVHVAGYGQSALIGQGALINLLFTVVAGAATESPLTLAAFTFNEGEPDVITNNGQFTRVAPEPELSISGAVTYWTGGIPVPAVTITVAGPTSVQATTGNDGHFQVTVPQQGSYLVTAHKIGDHRESISAVDAAQIAQCVVQKADVVCDPVVSDVSGDGAVTAYDAARIAHFLVGLEGERTGLWQFSPPMRAHALLDQPINDEDFSAYLLGDVNGNWPKATQNATAASVQSTIRLTVTQVSATPGTEIAVPISIGDIGEQEVLAYEFTLTYDKDVLQFQRLVVTDTLSEGWPVVYNDQTPGILPIVGYHSDKLAEDGLLLKLIFMVNENAPEQTAITVAKNRIMDQVLPPANIIDERVSPPSVFLPTIAR